MRTLSLFENDRLSLERSIELSAGLIYTMSFAYEEVTFLSALLEAKFNVSSKILTNKKNQPFIRIPANQKDRLKEKVAIFKIPGMEYKYQINGGID